MNRKAKGHGLIAFLMLVIPLLLHGCCRGPYVVDPEGSRQTFWIGPISTTIPFALLAILFLGHAYLLRRRPHLLLSAYLAAAFTWCSMIGFSIYLINQTAGSELSSTIAIAVGLTPFVYIPFLFVPYLLGTVLGLMLARPTSDETRG